MRNMYAASLFAALALFGCSRQERAEAGNKTEQAARKAEGALRDAGASLSDGGITMKVKSAMSLSGKLNTAGIDVDTKDKVVYLRGTVPDGDQRALAERIARDTAAAGVAVVNELKVAPKSDKK